MVSDRYHLNTPENPLQFSEDAALLPSLLVGKLFIYRDLFRKYTVCDDIIKLKRQTIVFCAAISCTVKIIRAAGVQAYGGLLFKH